MAHLFDMRLSRIQPLLLFPLLLLAWGCGGTRLVYDVDPSFANSSQRTVAPDPRRDRMVIREGMRPLNPELHLKAALTELETRHYLQANPDEADLWLSAYILIPGAPEGQARGPEHREGGGEGRHGGGRGGAGRSGGSQPSHEGKGHSTLLLIIQLQDRKTGQRVWHGEMSIDPKDKDAEGRPLGIEAAVHRLLQPLPARP
ncbi:hypothetical protein [Geothrix sp. PMB-07]|uniref:hypothetical protein n=1 Tax=Geothrix sp. PMB-07 TaxID=3068640 RepID=UPI002740E695|nr:hypothetical protein [Geothrix sp. PMB-07]WLT33380.1 hypothetical protein Q9293_08580 [Geothrix sp. PMB-07]